MWLSLSIQVQEPGPVSCLEAKAPSKRSTLASWYPVAPKPIGRSLWGRGGGLKNG